MKTWWLSAFIRLLPQRWLWSQPERDFRIKIISNKQFSNCVSIDGKIALSLSACFAFYHKVLVCCLWYVGRHNRRTPRGLKITPTMTAITTNLSDDRVRTYKTILKNGRIPCRLSWQLQKFRIKTKFKNPSVEQYREKSPVPSSLSRP